MGTRHSHSARRPPAASVSSPPGWALPGNRAVWGVILIVLVHVIFFRSVLFEGRSFVSPDTVQAAAPAHRYATSYQSRFGASPRWIPHVFAGMPARGSMMLPVDYPLNRLLQGILGSVYGSDESKVLHHILGAVWTFLLCRRWGAGVMGAALGGCGYSLATGLVSVTAADHGGKLFTASYIPLLLLAATFIIERVGFGATALTSLVVGLSLRAKHPQIAYYGLMAFGLLILWHVPTLLRRGIQSAARVVMSVLTAGAIGYLIAAPLTLPAQEYAPYSIRGAGPGGGLAYDYATQWSFHPAEAVTFLIPGFFGFGGATYWGHMPFTDAPNYGGVLILTLAVMGAVAAFRDARVRVLLVTMAFALLVSFGKHFPVVYNLLFHHLPQFNRFRVPVLILVLFQLGSCVLAGLGVRALASATVPTLRRWGWGMIIAAGLLICVGLVGSGPAGKATRAGEERLPIQTRSSVAAERSHLVQGDGLRSALLLAASGGLLLWVGYRAGRRWPTAQAAAAVIALVSIIDVWGVSARLVHPEYRKRDVERSLTPTSAEQWLANEPGQFRVLPLGERANSNRLMAFDVESVAGYYPAKVARYAKLLDSGALQSLPVLRMLATRYVLSPSKLRSDVASPIRSFGSEYVYELPEPLPRAWCAPRWTVETGDEVIRRVSDPLFLPESLAVVESDPGIAPVGEGTVTSISRPRPERLEIDVSIERDVVLVISEIYYKPGWRATIDGRSAIVFPVNQVLSGVVVPKGAHRVAFWYESRAETRGTTYALVGWLAVAGLGAVALLRREIPVAAVRRRRTGAGT